MFDLVHDNVRLPFLSALILVISSISILSLYMYLPGDYSYLLLLVLPIIGAAVSIAASLPNNPFISKYWGVLSAVVLAGLHYQAWQAIYDSDATWEIVLHFAQVLFIVMADILTIYVLFFQKLSFYEQRKMYRESPANQPGSGMTWDWFYNTGASSIFYASMMLSSTMMVVLIIFSVDSISNTSRDMLSTASELNDKLDASLYIAELQEQVNASLSSNVDSMYESIDTVLVALNESGLNTSNPAVVHLMELQANLSGILIASQHSELVARVTILSTADTSSFVSFVDWYDSAANHVLVPAIVAIILTSMFVIYLCTLGFIGVVESAYQLSCDHPNRIVNWRPSKYGFTNSPTYYGAQLSALLVGYVLAAILMVLTIYLCTWGKLYVYLWEETTIFAWCIQFAVFYLLKTILLDGKFAANYLLDNNESVQKPIGWGHYYTLSVFYGLIGGLQGALYRFLYLICIGFLFICRVDTTQFPESFESYDSIYISTRSFIRSKFPGSNETAGLTKGLESL